MYLFQAIRRLVRSQIGRGVLKCQIEARDRALHILAYRWCVPDRENAGHERAEEYVAELLKITSKGESSPDDDTLPDDVKLWDRLRTEYAKENGITPKPIVYKRKPFPVRVIRFLRKLVVEKLWEWVIEHIT